jgi:prepilin-type N-terminal cleavage/methylation domain-containing protein
VAKRLGAGFTLIELLIVIMLIGILVGIMLPAIGKMKERARLRQVEAGARGLENAIRAYHHEYNLWPGLTPDQHRMGGTYTFQGQNNEQVVRYLLAWNNDRHVAFWDAEGAVRNATGGYYEITIRVGANEVTVR